MKTARSVGIGVIGMGWMGQSHSRAYLQVPVRFDDAGLAPRLVACADELPERAEQVARTLGFERSFSDWRRVIDDPEVEAVDVTVPNYMHLEVVRAAVEAGKHVYCEKPVGRGPKETAEIERLARQAGVLTFVGFNYRWAPLVQYARQLVEEGRLGEITHYRGRFFAGYASDPQAVLSWRFEREKSGLGTLGDLMSHVIDMAHMIAGPIESLTANRATFVAKRPLADPEVHSHFSVGKGGPTGDVTNEDYVGALVRFEAGAHGTLEACRVITGPKTQMAFEVNGTRGALSWDFERMNELVIYSYEGTGDPEGRVLIQSGPEHPFHARFNPGPAIGLGYEDLKVIEAYQFVRSIAEGIQAEPGFSEVLGVAAVQDAALRSWDTDGWEKVRSLR